MELAKSDRYGLTNNWTRDAYNNWNIFKEPKRQEYKSVWPMTQALLYWSPWTKLVNYRLVHWNYRRRKNYHLPKWRTSTRQRVMVKFCQIKNIYFLHTCFILLNLNWEFVLILWALKSKWWIDGDYFVLYCRFMILVNELFLIIKNNT